MLCICYSNLKRCEVLPLVAMWMDLENIVLDEVGQTE